MADIPVDTLETRPARKLPSLDEEVSALPMAQRVFIDGISVVRQLDGRGRCEIFYVDFFTTEAQDALDAHIRNTGMTSVVFQPLGKEPVGKEPGPGLVVGVKAFAELQTPHQLEGTLPESFVHPPSGSWLKTEVTQGRLRVEIEGEKENMSRRLAYVTSEIITSGLDIHDVSPKVWSHPNGAMGCSFSLLDNR